MFASYSIQRLNNFSIVDVEKENADAYCSKCLRSLFLGYQTSQNYFSEFSAEFDSGKCAGTSLPNSSERW
jgi:hypothetical protein